MIYLRLMVLLAAAWVFSGCVNGPLGTAASAGNEGTAGALNHAPARTESANGPTVIGYVEWIRLVSNGLALEARMDTGATTSSIHAEDIVEFERDGESWVRFKTGVVSDEGDGETVTVERPVVRNVTIRQHTGEGDARYVVELEIYLGERHLKGEFTLADRSRFNYQGILGRNLLSQGFLVDSEKSRILGVPVE
jgi:hypothetical protein